MNDDVVDINEFRNKRDQRLLSEAENTEKKAEKRNRAHVETFVMMLAVAIFFDVVQLMLVSIPFLGWGLSALVGVNAWLTFYIWTSIKGWGFSDTLKQVMLNWVIPAVEVVPILNAFPTWTLKVVLTYTFLKAEDALYNISGGRADAEKVERLLKRVA